MKGLGRRATAASIAIAVASAAMSLVPQAVVSQSAQPDVAPRAYADESGNGEILEPGAYVLTAVPPLSITFTVPEGWYKGNVEFVAWENNSNSSIGFQSPANVFADPCDPAAGMRDPAVGPTASDLAAALGSARGLTAGAVQDITVAGYPGKRVDISADPAEVCDETALWDFAGVTVPGPGPGASDSFWILDVDGTRLVIVTRTRAGAPPDVTTELESILESIVIETP